MDQKDIRRARLARGLTLDDLGRTANVERTKLSRAERSYVVLEDAEMQRVDKALRSTRKSSR